DADIEHHAVEPAEAIHRLVDHAVHIGFAGDVGLYRERPTALGYDAPDGVVGAGAKNVGDRDMGALFGEQQRHRPAVADRIGRGIEGALSTADDQDPAALEPLASRRFTSGFRAERANVT